MTSGAFASMAERLADAQRELAVLRMQVTPRTG
jgi:hypothetical protein